MRKAMENASPGMIQRLIMISHRILVMTHIILNINEILFEMIMKEKRHSWGVKDNGKRERKKYSERTKYMYNFKRKSVK
jgi:hypothetical protein